MPIPVREENYKLLFPRSAAILQEIRSYPENPILYVVLQRKLVPKFGSEKLFTEAINFLERELKIAVQTIREPRFIGTDLRYMGEKEVTYVGIIPEAFLRSFKILMQILPSHFIKAYNMKK